LALDRISLIIASTASGEAPKGFSFDANLIISVIPYSRVTSSTGLPGTYSLRTRIQGRAILLTSNTALPPEI
ncbi:MAG: hypothetical protein ABFD07_04475, partial [Methanobacterium sp.]